MDQNDKIALALFAEVAEKVSLTGNLCMDDCYITFPVQDGLCIETTLALIGDDELWMTVGAYGSAGPRFVRSAFPLPDPAVVDRFREAAEGFLSGRWRIRSRWFSARLESPTEDGWKTEASYSSPTAGWIQRMIRAKE
jgi:hypothetical protein